MHQSNGQKEEGVATREWVSYCSHDARSECVPEPVVRSALGGDKVADRLGNVLLGIATLDDFSGERRSASDETTFASDTHWRWRGSGLSE